jgi:hypothetical protein
MSVWLIATLTGLGGLFLGVCSDMISEEMRGRLDRLPQALVRLAARRLPEEIRDDMAREWLAELHEFLHGAEAIPVTRLVKGLGYARGLFFSAPRFGREHAPVKDAGPKISHQVLPSEYELGRFNVIRLDALANISPSERKNELKHFGSEFEVALARAIQDKMGKGSNLYTSNGLSCDSASDMAYSYVDREGELVRVLVQVKSYKHRRNWPQ